MTNGIDIYAPIFVPLRISEARLLHTTATTIPLEFKMVKKRFNDEGKLVSPDCSHLS